MKTLIVLFMAVAAINAFYIDEDAKKELIQSMEKIFLGPHKFSQNGTPIPQKPGVKFAEVSKALETWKNLSNEEKDEIRKHIFNGRRPGPRPAHHNGAHFNEEKFKEIHEKWEAMTPEEREEFLNNKRNEFNDKFGDIKTEGDVLIHRFPRPMPGLNGERPLIHFNEEKIKEMHEKWEAMTPEEREEVRNNRRKEFQRFESLTPEEQDELKERIFSERFPNHHHRHFDNEKFEEMHEKFIEKHEEIKARHPRSFQPIQPLPEFFPNNAQNNRPILQKPILRNPYESIGRQRPMPERPIGGFQPIVPLPDFQSIPMIRPANEIENLDVSEISEEENLRDLFPDGLPIKPIGVIPAENGKLIMLSGKGQNIRQGPMPRPTPEDNLRPIRPTPEDNSRPIRPMVRPAQFQPIMPIQFQPIIPLPEFFPRNL